MKNDDEDLNNFLKTYFSFGVVIRADLQEIQRLKKVLSDLDIKICFQKMSTNKLFISEQPSKDTCKTSTASSGQKSAVRRLRKRRKWG